MFEFKIVDSISIFGEANILIRRIVDESSGAGAQERSDAEFRLRFFDLVVEKIPRRRRPFLCFVSFGRAKEMKMGYGIALYYDFRKYMGAFKNSVFEQ